MRRIPGFEKSLKLSGITGHSRVRFPSVCAACKHRAFSTSIIRSTQPTWTARESNQRGWTSSQTRIQENDRTNGAVESKSVLTEKPEETQECRKPPASKGYEPRAYEPATTSEKLDNVGRLPNAWDDYWNARLYFEGFSRGSPITDPLQVTAAVRRAVVEVFAVQQTGTSGFSATAPGANLAHEAQIRLPYIGVELHSATSDPLQIIPSRTSLPRKVENVNNSSGDNSKTTNSDALDATPSTDFPAEIHVNRGFSEPQVAPGEKESYMDAAMERSPEVSLSDITASLGPSWREISLASHEMRFAVLRRIMQLTGLRVPDFAISSTTTVGLLLDRIITPPKPRKVSDALAQENGSNILSNVYIRDRRITLIDRERRVGRWKVIEQELLRRELPAPKLRAL